MTLSLGVNLRVTGHCNQGGRKYMEGKINICNKGIFVEKLFVGSIYGQSCANNISIYLQMYSVLHINKQVTKKIWSTHSLECLTDMAVVKQLSIQRYEYSCGI